MAPQFTVTNLRRTRTLFEWMARATSSLPVPLSPVTSTLLSLDAAWRMTRKVSRISGLLPMMFWNEYRVSIWVRSATFSRSSLRFSSARLIGIRTSSGVKGLGM